MTIPKKLKIGEHVVKIVFVEKIEGDDCGFADFDTNTIQIDKKLSQSMKEVTLFHEILHFINSDFHGASSWSHSLLESLAQAVYQVLRDNKLLK